MTPEPDPSAEPDGAPAPADEVTDDGLDGVLGGYEDPKITSY